MCSKVLREMQATADYVMKHKEKKVDKLVASLLMLSGAADADPVLLQRIATKKADPEEVQAALIAGGGVPVHLLRARQFVHERFGCGR